MRLFFRKPFKYTFFNATLALIIINFAIYLLTYSLPRITLYLGLNPLGFWYYKMYWQPFTYMFVHGNIPHIIFNMLALVVFGIQVEKTLGSKEFLLYYLLCGILCGFSSLFVYTFFRINVLLMGASGAIFSVLLMYAVIFPRSRIYIWGILPVPAPILVLIYAIIELGSQFFLISSNVAHLTHLSGFAAGYLYLVIRMGIHPLKIWKDAYLN